MMGDWHMEFKGTADSIQAYSTALSDGGVAFLYTVADKRYPSVPYKQTYVSTSNEKIIMTTTEDVYTYYLNDEVMSMPQPQQDLLRCAAIHDVYLDIHDYKHDAFLTHRESEPL